MEVLHDAQVGIKVMRAPNLITPLLSPAIDRRGELSRGQARSVKSIARTHYRPPCKVVREHIIACTGAIVESVQCPSSTAVGYRKRQSAPCEHGPRNCPVGDCTHPPLQRRSVPNVVHAGVV